MSHNHRYDTAVDGRRRGAAPDHFIDEEWVNSHQEPTIDPVMPIIDCHHHVWALGSPYLVPQLLVDLYSGHNIRATVYVEAARFMFHAEGDPRFACLGEVEAINQIGESFATGLYGPSMACAGIVANPDLTQGAAVREVLERALAIAPDRLRGVRHMAAWDASPEVHQLMRPPPPNLMETASFREGFAQLAPLDMTFDSWCYHPQLPELIALADAFPQTRIAVNHAGGLIGQGPYARAGDDSFAAWRSAMRELAKRPNIFVKLGGLTQRLSGFDFSDRTAPATSEELAESWYPIIDTCIAAFGPSRAMFESNFPPDKAGCSYNVLWNAFKRLAKGYSDDEKRDLFAGTAARAYRLPIEM